MSRRAEGKTLVDIYIRLGSLFFKLNKNFKEELLMDLFIHWDYGSSMNAYKGKNKSDFLVKWTLGVLVEKIFEDKNVLKFKLSEIFDYAPLDLKKRCSFIFEDDFGKNLYFFKNKGFKLSVDNTAQ